MKCIQCHHDFEPPHERGPVPSYCGQVCRQRAYEIRRLQKIEIDRDKWRAEAKRLAQSLDDWGYGDYEPAPHTFDEHGVCEDCGETERSCPYRSVPAVLRMSALDDLIAAYRDLDETWWWDAGNGHGGSTGSLGEERERLIAAALAERGEEPWSIGLAETHEHFVTATGHGQEVRCNTCGELFDIVFKTGS